eukprot:scaffold80543_cov63-Phaeocystis_antarctica.AAC.1
MQSRPAPASDTDILQSQPLARKRLRVGLARRVQPLAPRGAQRMRRARVRRGGLEREQHAARQLRLPLGHERGHECAVLGALCTR